METKMADTNKSLDSNFEELYTSSLMRNAGIGGTGGISGIGDIAKKGLLGGVAGLFAGGPPGFLIGSIVSTIGSIISAFTGSSESQLTPEQTFFQHLVDSYHDIGERNSKFQNIIYSATGIKPKMKTTSEIIDADWDSKIQPSVAKMASLRVNQNSNINQINKMDLYGNVVNKKEEDKNASNL
jgi:hypothetical protein